MANLLKAEFRKVVTTNLWWALLIPTVLLALGWAWGAGFVGAQVDQATSSADFQSLQRTLGINSDQWKWSVFGMARSINIATLFPLVFGALAISGEYSRKTITTTFLTAPDRFSALSAKLLTYVAWGALYGLAIVAMVSLGIAIPSEASRLPGASGWLALLGVGIIASVLMTLFGVGIGALVRNVPATVVLLVLYFLLVENGLAIVLAFQLPELIGYLPNGSINGLTGSVAADIFLASADSVRDNVEEFVRFLAGARGAFDWWASGLIFLGWTALAFGGGWLATQKRDIT